MPLGRTVCSVVPVIVVIVSPISRQASADGGLPARSGAPVSGLGGAASRLSTLPATAGRAGSALSAGPPAGTSALRSAAARPAPTPAARPGPPGPPPPPAAPPRRAALARPRGGRLQFASGRGLALLPRLADAAPGQVDAAQVVDLLDLDQQLVADLDHVLDLAHPTVGELGDVHQAFLAGQHLHEGAEVHQPGDAAQVHLADLHLTDNLLDHLHRPPRRLLVHGGDVDAPVLLDVDLGAGLLGDLVDPLAAGADDLADPLRVDLDGQDTRRVGRQRRARCGDDLQHALQDE